MDWLPWNLVHSIGVLGAHHIQMMTGLTLTQFTSRSNLVAYAFVWEKVDIINLNYCCLWTFNFVFAIN